jgi:cobalamin synthase
VSIYFKWFAPEATQRFTRWYFQPTRRHRQYWAVGCWPLMLFLLFCLFAMVLIAAAGWLAVVLAIWIAQLFTTLGQLIWWPMYVLGGRKP